MTRNDIIFKEISKELEIDEKTVRDVVNSVFRFIKKDLSGYDVEELSEEDFKTKRVCYDIPYFGRFYTNFKIVDFLKKKLNRLKLEKHEREKIKNQKNNPNVHGDCNNDGQIC